jgi:hypothetical protein
MADAAIRLTVVEGSLVICRLGPGEPPPAWGMAGELWSVTRTGEELSVVCAWGAAPEGVRREGPWRALKVAGPLDFALTGVLSAIAAPLADAGVSIFAVSTYDTDYVLVREERVGDAVAALRAAGLRVV